MAQIFSSAEAQRGGVVKRKIQDVERLVGRSVFTHELRKRGFQAVENGNHFVIFCNNHPIRPVKLPAMALTPPESPWPQPIESPL